MADPKTAEFSDLLREDRTFPPSEAFRAQALVRDEAIYEEAARDPEAFWAKFAANSSGRRRGRRCSTGSRRTRSGSSAASSTPASNCLDRHVRGAAAQQGRASSGKASPATAAR